MIDDGSRIVIFKEIMNVFDQSLLIYSYDF